MTTSTPPFDDPLIDKALAEPESYTFDCKRIKKDLTKTLETRHYPTRFDNETLVGRNLLSGQRL